MIGTIKGLVNLGAFLVLGGIALPGCANLAMLTQKDWMDTQRQPEGKSASQDVSEEQEATLDSSKQVGAVLPTLIPTALAKEPLEQSPTPPSTFGFVKIVESTESATQLLFRTQTDAPLGFAGRSRVLPRDGQQDNHFVPVDDRWRIGFPEWDRYGKGHPRVDDYPYAQGRWWDPFNQNVLKGDYPIYGQNIFLELTGTTQALFEPRQAPTGTTPFESTTNPGQKDFFGSPNQFFYSQNFFLSFDLFRGNAAFRPVDWRIKMTPAFNINYLSVDELGVVSPDVTKGTTRGRTFATLQEWFAEYKIADLSDDFDFLSIRAGSQPFTSDFRGFLFSDVNRGVRLFGNQFANRDQFNVVYFNLLEKDTNSGLNTFRNRNQQVVIANYYRQDFIWPGYTAQFSFHYNHDAPTTKFDNNGFLVRPDPVGTYQPHTVDVVYLGWTGDGHINRLNVNHAFYWALGRDSHNPLANQSQRINGQMAALELSYDMDWIRFRTSFFWSSGDRDIRNGSASGFDTIQDNPNFAGGEFTYWQRQQLRLFGVNLNQRMSLVPDLRASKIQGQANFVNPGLYLGNFGFDVEATPKLRIINNANVLWFDSLNPLQQFVYQQTMHRFIGVDLSTGVEYRPLLSNNVIFKAGISTLLPGQGFRDLFSNFDGSTRPLVAGFVEAVLTF
ncbi:MAG: hypothetical protein EXR98_17990 [Gemmataceae bacterium]|nr:hypothetical protein [Gemmataceae bacterium]